MYINYRTADFNRSCYFESFIADPVDIYPGSHTSLDYVTSSLHLLVCSSGYKSIHDHSETVSSRNKAQQAIQKNHRTEPCWPESQTTQTRQCILQFFAGKLLTTFVSKRSILHSHTLEKNKREICIYSQSLFIPQHYWHQINCFPKCPGFGNIKYCSISLLVLVLSQVVNNSENHLETTDKELRKVHLWKSSK